MCGIIHVKKFNGSRAAKTVTKRYQRQKERGKEGFGFVSLVDEGVGRYVRCETEEEILRVMRQEDEGEILFHHRKPTSTPNFKQAAHPIKVDHKSLNHIYYIAHNGVVHGTDKLKEIHEKAGFKYQTALSTYFMCADKTVRRDPKGDKWNDSEAFAIELARDIDGAEEGLSHISGTVAFVAIQIDKKTKRATSLFWGRNYGSPLKYEKTRDYMVISSDCAGEEVKAHILHEYDYETGSIVTRAYSVGTVSYNAASSSTVDTTDRVSNWEDRKSRIGFDRPEAVTPLIEAAKTELPLTPVERAEAIAQYMDDHEELNRVEQMLIKEGNPPDVMADLAKRKEELDASIKNYDDKYAISPYYGLK